MNYGTHLLQRMEKYITIRPWTSNAPYHLEVKKDEMVTIRKYVDRPEWEEWIWCETTISSGFVPQTMVKEIDDTTGQILEDYTAKELSVSAGEIINGARKHQGWVYGENDRSKEKGWLPNEILLKLKA